MCHYDTIIIETEKGSVNVYFEKQSRLFCLVHTTNNILQAHVYSPDDFKNIESKLNYSDLETNELKNNNDKNLEEKYSFDIKRENEINYKNIFSYFKRGTFFFGNFNINILYFLMNKHNIELCWVDNKEIFEKINNNNCSTIFDDKHLNNKNLIAFIINVVKIKFFDLYYHRHFYTIRKISGLWFHLDSSLHKPIMLPSNKDVNDHLISILKDNKFHKSDNYIIQVFKKEKHNSV
ncbi:conserved Plasmodium protein, unknown function [Plasmodium gallinaceum]|uniref:ubiquitinyl hydrolase 1 n=1 Tax=Plasmodium gallinaceum TaxID=5849 RepID=A0A1J1GUP0_PLAGA|nr:conserved Plasmodium protein, unknown function [Plasmodium gallinaceum]CRG96170.1 conserved Plasmodium protein, unknown function [Plasmodium gallinaceum]